MSDVEELLWLGDTALHRRICTRFGCGREIAQRILRRNPKAALCSKECKQADRNNARNAKKARIAKAGRCGTCGTVKGKQAGVHACTDDLRGIPA